MALDLTEMVKISTDKTMVFTKAMMTAGDISLLHNAF